MWLWRYEGGGHDSHEAEKNCVLTATCIPAASDIGSRMIDVSRMAIG